MATAGAFRCALGKPIPKPPEILLGANFEKVVLGALRKIFDRVANVLARMPRAGCRCGCLFPVDGLNLSVVSDRLLVEVQTADITSCGGELRADFAVNSEELGGAATNVSRKCRA